MATPRWRFWLPLSLVLLDLAWTLSALNPKAVANEASTVGMINTVVWIFLHLPAALLGSLPFSSAGDGPLPSSELFLIGCLGLAQAAGLGWWAGRSLDLRVKS